MQTPQPCSPSWKKGKVSEKQKKIKRARLALFNLLIHSFCFIFWKLVFNVVNSKIQHLTVLAIHIFHIFLNITRTAICKEMGENAGSYKPASAEEVSFSPPLNCIPKLSMKWISLQTLRPYFRILTVNRKTQSVVFKIWSQKKVLVALIYNSPRAVLPAQRLNSYFLLACFVVQDLCSLQN